VLQPKRKASYDRVACWNGRKIERQIMYEKTLF
jgi:hypothetical protein